MTKVFALAALVITATSSSLTLGAAQHDHPSSGGRTPVPSEKRPPKPRLRPPEGAAVKIITPKEGQIFKGDSVPLEFSLKKGKRGEHVHAYVDGEMMGMFKGSKGTLNGIKPGRHTLELRVGTADHETELDATDRVSFTTESAPATRAVKPTLGSCPEALSMRDKRAQFVFCALFALVLTSCSSSSPNARTAHSSAALNFGPQRELGKSANNPSAPFLRFAPDGRLFAVWTEDETGAGRTSSRSSSHHHSSKMAPSPMRNALLAASADGGRTWTTTRRINSNVEPVQSEENGPRLAFDNHGKAFVVWSVPGAKGDKTRANVRFAMEDGKDGFTPALTLNEVKDAARFPVIEATIDGGFLIAWIDRRIDNPKPRQLYLMKLGADGRPLTKNYPVGEGLCECCKLGIAFADGGKTVYIVDREVDGNNIRNHVLRKSIDGGAAFNPPVQISNDGWQVPSCPHSGPSIGRDSRGWLHVSWFTLGRSGQDAGIYYSISKDQGKSFSPRRLVHGNSAPEILYNSLVAGDDDMVYLAWTNLDAHGKAQVYMRTIAADGNAWSPVQQVSKANGNAGRPVLAVRNNQLHVAWTETNGEDSRAILRSVELAR